MCRLARSRVICTASALAPLVFHGMYSLVCPVLQPDNLKPFDNGTHVGFQDQVVLGDAEVVPDILPLLNPLLLWLITALSSLGVPFLPLALRSLYRQKQAAAGLQLGAEQGAQRSQSRLDRLFGKAFVNPQDIALLEQQVARRERTPVLRVRQGGEGRVTRDNGPPACLWFAAVVHTTPGCVRRSSLAFLCLLTTRPDPQIPPARNCMFDVLLAAG